MWLLWILIIIGLITLVDWLTYKYIKGDGRRSNEFRVCEGFTIYGGPHNLAFHFEPDYDDSEHMQLIAATMWHQFFVHIPWWKVPEGINRWDDDKYRFGFYLYNDYPKKLFHTINIFWCSWSKYISMPWGYECHHTIYEGKNGKRYIEFYDEYRKRNNRAKRYNAKPTDIKDSYDYYRSNDFSWEAPYEYTTKSGEVQRTIGRYHIEEREWRQRWLYWCKLFCHRRRCVDIELMDEMGEKVGTWKGGVMSFGADMLPGEDVHAAYKRIMKTKVLD